MTHTQKDKSPGTALSIKKHNNNSNEEFSNTTLSMLGASMRADSPVARLGYQASFSPRKSSRSGRGMNRDATLTTTLASAAGRLGNRDDGVCRRIKLENFKAIYGHGLNVKFVKLLFMLLKKQVPRFIEYINIQASQQPELRYSLLQYFDLLKHIWKTQLDTENNHEITEGKFYKFLRENKILTEKKQMDEMYKQCIFAKKTEEVNVTASVTFILFERLFAKPLLLLAMENALALLEERRDFDGKPGSNGKQFWPEMDKTSLG